MLRPSILALILLPLVIAACAGKKGDFCPPDGGVFCWRDDDVKACKTLGANMSPYCCCDEGGHVVDCGQPSNCVPKPGIPEGAVPGANYCCPQ